MKTCVYCGKDNDDAAVACTGCGTSEFRTAAASDLEQSGTKSVENGGQLREILTDPARLFRVLIIVSTTAYVIWFFELPVCWRLISSETRAALAWRGCGAWLTIPPKLDWLFMLLWVAAAVGLWGFSKSARLVFAALTVFFGIMSFLSGVQVSTPLGSFVLQIMYLADGAILLMAYTAPLKNRFV
jgi:hypothetical protein